MKCTIEIDMGNAGFSFFNLIISSVLFSILVAIFLYLRCNGDNWLLLVIIGSFCSISTIYTINPMLST